MLSVYATHNFGWISQWQLWVAWCGVVSRATWLVDGFPTVTQLYSPPSTLRLLSPSLLPSRLLFNFFTFLSRLATQSTFILRRFPALSDQLVLLEVLRGCSSSSAAAPRRPFGALASRPNLINMNRVSCILHSVLELRQARDDVFAIS
jgi:hypothetical protein